MFELYFTGEAEKKLEEIKTDKGLQKRYKAVVKCIKYLIQNPRHPSLNTHKYSSLSGPNGEEIFEAYAEQKTPAAYRVFWYYGPERQCITILSVTVHP